MAPGVSEGILHAENDCDFNNSEVFGVSDYSSLFRLKKFKIADPIWWSGFIKINQIYFQRKKYQIKKKCFLDKNITLSFV